MPLLTQFASFFISPFGETSVCDDLNQFLKSHRIVNLEKKLKAIDPDMAMRFAYLDLRGEEATRAADAAGMRKVVLWEEE